MHSVQVFSRWCARGLWASQPPGTVSGHTKGGVHSPRNSRDVHIASQPRSRRVAALTHLSMLQEEAPLLPGVAYRVAYRVASRRRESPTVDTNYVSKRTAFRNISRAP